MGYMKTGVEQSVLSESSDPKLTIVIPCYNTSVEQLERCTASILRQTLSDYEAIFVDDGSDKPHLEVLQDISKRDSRFSLVQMPHRGVSVARNAALNRMRGKYVTFMDSDDELVESFLEEAVFALESENLDIVYGKIEKTYQGKRTSTIDPLSSEMSVYEGEGLVALRRCVVSTLPPIGYDELRCFNSRSVASKVYRAASFEGLRFQEEAQWGEDHLFNSEALDRVSRVGLVNKVWYIYHKNNGSATLSGTTLADNCCDYIESLFATGRRLGWRKDDLELTALMAVSMVLDGMAHSGSDSAEMRRALGKIYSMPSFPRTFTWQRNLGLQLSRKQRLMCWLISRRWRYVYIALFRVKRAVEGSRIPV